MPTTQIMIWPAKALHNSYTYDKRLEIQIRTLAEYDILTEYDILDDRTVERGRAYGRDKDDLKRWVFKEDRNEMGV